MKSGQFRVQHQILGGFEFREVWLFGGGGGWWGSVFFFGFVFWGFFGLGIFWFGDRRTHAQTHTRTRTQRSGWGCVGDWGGVWGIGWVWVGLGGFGAV